MKKFKYLFPMNWPFILWTACFLEIITYIFRFGLDIHSKSIQKKARLPFRVHHMYIGALIAVPGFFYTTTLFPDFILGGTGITLLDIGITIALSDMFHHFSVLPLFHQKIDFP